MKIAGWDIGGANCKAYLAGVSATRPLAVWREPERLPEVLKAMADELGPVESHAITMTAELCDCFASKADGVRYVLRAATSAFGTVPIHVWTNEGCFHQPKEIERRPALAAAANWLATGTLLARRCDTALLIDIGTTTTDLTPIVRGAVAAVGRDDPVRLARGELVYTGFVRTPVCAVAPALYLNGWEVRLAAELFATTGDAYLLLGMLDPSDCPDGADAARQRLARMLCADAADLGEPALRWLARQVMEAQIALVTRAAMQVLSRMARPDRIPVVGAGLGRSLARRVAGRLGLPYADLTDLGLEGGQAAPAAAVAQLLAAEDAATWSAMRA